MLVILIVTQIDNTKLGPNPEDIAVQVCAHKEKRKETKKILFHSTRKLDKL
jgi:hypothetical protein